MKEEDSINLPCRNLAEKLLASLNTRDKALRPDNKLTIDTDLLFRGEKLKLFLVDPEDFQTINQAYTLLRKFFVRGDLISQNALIRNMHGYSKHFKERPKYRLFVVKNQGGEIIGVRIMEQIPLVGSMNENILYAIYIALDNRYQGMTGIAKQLYVSSLIDSAIEADKVGKKIVSIVAECSDATENLQNSVGLKRVYFKRGDVLTELNFKQPYLSFNPITGYPTDPVGKENKDHFMISFFDNETISKDDLLDQVISLFVKYESNKIESDFRDERGFINYHKYFLNIEEEIKRQFETGDIFLLSKMERIMYQNQYGQNSVISHKKDDDID